MSATAGETIPPGHASPTARPGVWLTELSLVSMALIWGVNFSVVKYGTSLVEPLVFNGVRLSLAALLLCAIVLIGRIPLPSGRTILVLLLLGVERLNRRAVIGVAASVVGIGFVVIGSSRGEGRSSVLGLTLVLCGSLAWALYTVLLKPHTERVSGTQLSTLTMLGGAVPLLAVAWPAMSHTRWSTVPLLGWGALAYSAIFSLVVAYYFWYHGVKTIGPTRTSMYSNLQPIIAVLVAWAMLGEVPTIWQVVGTGCIMGSLVLARP